VLTSQRHSRSRRLALDLSDRVASFGVAPAVHETCAPAAAARVATSLSARSLEPVISTVPASDPCSLHHRFAAGGLLCGGPPLKDPLRPLELGAPSRAEVLPAAIDEVLDHSDSGPETAWGHIVARVLIEKSIEDRHSISKSVISV